jgi:dihydrofolate reductase
MTISLVVAASSNNVIGRDGELPWHLPDDLRHFKRLTTGKPVIMGRKTFESIGRPLPDRRSVSDAIDLVEGAAEVMIIGGGRVYHDFLPLADRIYLTRVQAEVEGDTHFPEVDEATWQLVSSEHHDADDRHRYAFDMMVFERRKP